jgi:hypothetical protein
MPDLHKDDRGKWVFQPGERIVTIGTTTTGETTGLTMTPGYHYHAATIRGHAGCVPPGKAATDMEGPIRCSSLKPELKNI